jgi:hypothetical protein
MPCKAPTQAVVCKWLMEYAFGTESAPKDPGFPTHKWFKAPSGLSQFLNKKRAPLKKAAEKLLEKWAASILDGTETPHKAL